MNSFLRFAILLFLFICSIATASVFEVKCHEGHSLNYALSMAAEGDELIVSGTCQEHVVITTDGIILSGNGAAVIDGGGVQNAVTVDGAKRVVINGLKLQNGLIGLLGKSGANFSLSESKVKNNQVAGIQLEGQSSLETKNTVVEESGIFGVNIDRASEIKISGTFTSQNNEVWGIFFSTNSSGTFSKATVVVQDNVLGIQVGIGSSLNIADKETTVNANNNLTTGITIVSGSTLFVFEGSIIATDNKLNHGVSANSNSNIDLDRGGSIHTENNGLDGIQLENSLLNMFNMPGLPASTVTASQNGRHGIGAFVESVVDLSGDSSITLQNNGDTGLMVDNGSTARIINSSVNNNTNQDIAVTFGARAELRNNIKIGNVTCDATALIRGDSGVACPTQ